MVTVTTPEKKEKSINLEEKVRVDKLLKKVEINPEAVLVKREGEIITKKDKVNNNDNLELIRVVSGG